jgi:hypothetical protein
LNVPLRMIHTIIFTLMPCWDAPYLHALQLARGVCLPTLSFEQNFYTSVHHFTWYYNLVCSTVVRLTLAHVVTPSFILHLHSLIVAFSFPPFFSNLPILEFHGYANLRLPNYVAVILYFKQSRLSCKRHLNLRLILLLR